MHLEVAALVAASAIILLLGFVVLSKDWHQRVLIYFQILCLSVAVWATAIALFIRADAMATALIYANIYYAAALAISMVANIFIAGWIHIKYYTRQIWMFIAAFACYVAIVVVWPHAIIRSVYMVDGAKLESLNVLGNIIFDVVFLSLFSAALVRLYLNFRHLNALGKAQVRLVLAGLIVSGSIGVFFNLVLPWFGNYRLVWVGPLCSIIFSGFVGYAIVKRQLFDLRATIARSIAYGLSLLVLASVFGFVVFTIAEHVFNLHISLTAQILLSTATALAALTFHRTKRFFDRITNRFFYRDAYDSQKLYDQLNQTLVASQTMHEIIMKSLSIIETNLKPEFMFVGLAAGPDDYRVFSTRKLKLTKEDILQTWEKTKHLRYKVIVAENLDTALAKDVDLKSIMERNNLAVLVRLSHDIRLSEEGLGYLALGYKRSGNAYSEQDVEVLDTIANELVIAIQNALHVEEIQRFNVTLQKRVDEAMLRLRQTNKRLKLLDETKDDFISMASHQLRTPLTSVKGYISMVLDGDAGPIKPMQRQMLNQAFTSAQRMVYMIADLLNVSRLKTGKFVIEDAPLDLSQVVAEEISQLAEIAESKSIKLTYHKPDSLPLLNLDETKIRQVAMNFIDNSIYYTPPGGKIDVWLRETPSGSIEYKVVDTGIGVPQVERHRLFTKFYRATNAQNARPDGTGLGLFMAKKVVIAEGGAILFTSRENQGSTFGFTFPRSKVATEESKPAKPAVLVE